MWPFFLTREIVITKRIANSKENVLAVLRPDLVLRTIDRVMDDALAEAGVSPARADTKDR